MIYGWGIKLNILSSLMSISEKERGAIHKGLKGTIKNTIHFFIVVALA
jgi:hypothetical protein